MKCKFLFFFVSFCFVGVNFVKSQDKIIEESYQKNDSVSRIEYLGEVVISANRIPEKLSEIPASISLVNSKEIRRLTNNTTNINSILEQAVPGMAPNTGTYSNWGQTLRGRKLMVMIDGVPQSTPLRNGQLSIRSVIPQNIERVEVIKGASSIYGNGADGGFINYITKSPEKYSKLSGISQVWSTTNLVDTNDALGVGLSQTLSGTVKKTSYFVNIFLEKSGNKYDAKKRPLYPVYGLDNNKVVSAFGKFIQTFGENDRHRITISSQYFNAKQYSPFGKVQAKLITDENGDYHIEGGYGDTSKKDDREEPTGLETINFLTKYDLKNIFKNTSFSTDFYYNQLKGIFFYATTFKGGGQSAINSRKIGLRPSLISKLNIRNTPITINYGLDVLNDKTNQGLLDGRVWIPNLSLVSVAPYLQSKILFNSFWNIKAGIRYDNMDLKVPNYSTIPYSPKNDGNYNPSVPIKGGDLKFNNLSFNFGIRYIENSKFIPYVNYSQGYSLPDIGRNLRAAKDPYIISSIELEAAKTNNYEFGFLSKFKYFRFEAVGYYTTSNIGTGLSFNNDTNRFEASKDPQKVFGYELSLDTRFLDNKLNWGVTYTFTEGVKSPKNDKNSTSYTFLGGDVVAPPKFTSYISYEFNSKFNMNISFVKIFDRTRFNPIEKNSVWTYNYREVPVKGYSTLNLSASYNISSSFYISAGVNNILNNYYFPARSQWASPIANFTVAGEGVNGKLSLSYKF